MPKPMLHGPMNINETETVSRLSDTRERKTEANHNEKLKTDRLLRKTRSKDYVDAMCRLDAGGHSLSQREAEKILDIIKNEFPEVEIMGILLGCISACYLGEPYEVHTISLLGEVIIEHYKRGQLLPAGLEKARSLAIHGGYAFIEVYCDCCRCVSHDGTVSVVPC